MLLGYGAKNCWCFKEWLEISLRPGVPKPHDKNNGENETPPENARTGTQAQRLMGFQGANASGKTCALKVFAFITDFVLNSFSYEPESPLPYDTFFGSTDCSEFFAEFNGGDGREYRYEARLHRDHVETETVIRVGPAEEEIILQREKDTLTVNHLFSPGKVPVFRSNASVISTLRQHGVREISPVTDFFSGVITNVNSPGLTPEPGRLISTITEKYFRDRDALSFTAGLLRKLDTGIVEIAIRLRDDLLQEGPGQNAYAAVCMHETASGHSALPLEDESAGTRNCSKICFSFTSALRSGVCCSLMKAISIFIPTSCPTFSACSQILTATPGTPS